MNYEQQKLDYDRKQAERLAKVQEAFDFNKDILEYVNESMSDPALVDVKQKTIDALESADKTQEDIKTLGVLEQSIGIKIKYLGEKSHDTEEEEEYIVKLKLMLEGIQEIVNS